MGGNRIIIDDHGEISLSTCFRAALPKMSGLNRVMCKKLYNGGSQRPRQANQVRSAGDEPRFVGTARKQVVTRLTCRGPRPKLPHCVIFSFCPVATAELPHFIVFSL